MFFKIFMLHLNPGVRPEQGVKIGTESNSTEKQDQYQAIARYPVYGLKLLFIFRTNPSVNGMVGSISRIFNRPLLLYFEP